MGMWDWMGGAGVAVHEAGEGFDCRALTADGVRARWWRLEVQRLGDG